LRGWYSNPALDVPATRKTRSFMGVIRITLGSKTEFYKRSKREEITADSISSRGGISEIRVVHKNGAHLHGTCVWLVA